MEAPVRSEPVLYWISMIGNERAEGFVQRLGRDDRVCRRRATWIPVDRLALTGGEWLAPSPAQPISESQSEAEAPPRTMIEEFARCLEEFAKCKLTAWRDRHEERSSN